MFSHRLRRTGIHGKTSRSRSDESFKLLLVIPFAIFNPGYEQAERGGHLGKMGWERHSSEAEHSKSVGIGLHSQTIFPWCMSEVDSRVGYRNTDT